MKKTLAYFLLLFTCCTSIRASVLFEEVFDSALPSSLHGCSPQKNQLSEQWNAHSAFNANGTVDNTSIDSACAILPFQPKLGNRYRLTAIISDVDSSQSINNWLAVGFTTKNRVDTHLAAQHATMMLLRASGKIQVLISGGKLAVHQESPLVAIKNLTHTLNSASLTMVLSSDTNDVWTVEYLVDGETRLIGTYQSPPDITGVALSRYGNTTGRFSKLLLEVCSTGSQVSEMSQAVRYADEAAKPLFGAAHPKIHELQDGFDNPPREARPRVWWGWINGLISREGISKDLEALKAAGFDGACIFDTHMDNWPGFPKGDVLPLSTEWQTMFNHTAEKAAELDLRLSMLNCPGWSLAGGPWVKPEDALKQITMSVCSVQGGTEFNCELPLPALENGFYRDVAVLAVPIDGKAKRSEMTANLKRVLSYDGREIQTVTDGLPGTAEILPYYLYRTGKLKDLYMTLEFDQPLCADKIFILGYTDTLPRSFELWAGDSSDHLRLIKSFSVKSTGSGWTLAFPRTVAKVYRVQFKDSFHRWRMSVAEIELLKDDEVPRGDFPVPFWDMQTAKSGMNLGAAEEISRHGATGGGGISPNEIIDLTDHLDESGTLCWEIPPGQWEIFRIGYTTVVHRNHPTTPQASGLECDKMDAGAVRRHLEAYAGRYIGGLSSEARKAFSFLHIDSFEQRLANWTTDMPDKFQQINGYDLRPWLPILCGRVVGSEEQTARFLFDYRKAMSELLATQFYQEFTRFSHEMGLWSSAEACGPHPEAYQPYDPLRVKGMVDIPMGENWLNTADGRLPDQLGSLTDCRETASATHIYNKPIAQSETFTSYTATLAVDPLMTKSFGDLLFCEGINRFALHKYTHQPNDTVPGLPYHRFGSSFNRHQTWWDIGAPAWSDYLSRCQYLLQQGLHRADILYFYGENVTAFTDLKNFPESLRPPVGYDFDWINKEILLRDLSVESQELILPHGSRYKVLILPEGQPMSPELLAKIDALIRTGAVIVGAPPPHKSPSLINFPQCDEQAAHWVQRIWGDADDSVPGERPIGRGKVIWGTPLKEILTQVACHPDFEFQCEDTSAPVFDYSPADGRKNRIRYIHRRSEKTDFYFLSNQSRKPAQFRAVFRTAGGTPELWNPMDKTKHPMKVFEQNNETTTIDMQLPEYGSAFVVFNPEESSKDYSEAFPLKTLPLDGAWQVEFTPAYGPPFQANFADLISWPQHQQEDIRYFSGTAAYRKSFDLSREDTEAAARFSIDLGQVETIARVEVNGQAIATLWAPPYEVDVTDALFPGTNRLTIWVSNLWVNRLIGDAEKSENEQRTSTPFQLPASPIKYKPDDPLLPSGLIGPVHLRLLTE